MPGVEVFYGMNVGMSDEPASLIDQSIRLFGASELSVTEKILEQGDFSVKWHQPTKFDKLTHDIIIRARLDGSFEERRRRITDELAANFAVFVADDVASSYEGRNITIGVEIMLVGVGLFWGAASTGNPAPVESTIKLSAFEENDEAD